MKINGKLKKYAALSSAGGGILAILVFFIALSFFNPLGLPTFWNTSSLIEGTASTYQISTNIDTAFGSYNPQLYSYEPKNTASDIKPGLVNVDFQGLSVPDVIKPDLEKYGFALADEGYEDIYELYEGMPKARFVTTDLCLHAYHVLYDISLRILEGTYFAQDFETMLQTLRTDQILLNGTVTDAKVHDALNKNIAYLSIMLYLLDNTTNPIPSEVADAVNLELANIEAGQAAVSAIFGYEEDYTQYKVRGHYTRNDLLTNYFKAMMYAGRMGFLLQSPFGEIEMGIEHTRMALLLISSFNTTIGAESIWDYWDRIYQPTTFYVGSSDDLTALEYYQIWKTFSSPQGDLLANTTLILDIINAAQSYRNPLINSMFVNEAFDPANVTKGFRLMGQRFIPDSYIFQQLVHTKVPQRLMPNGLDIFSVFGSPRAAYYLQMENQTYPGYNTQILKLREEFGNLTEYDWTQNLYWLWLFSLFPLLKPATDGYPQFMLSNAWSDKALMTALGSWAELRHDTILYAKQSYTQVTSFNPSLPRGYVEPYPEVYARLGSLVRLMKNGLETRGLTITGFSEKLDQMAEVFDRLVTISIKELENQPFTEDDFTFILGAGSQIGSIASYSDPNASEYVSEADDRMAIIADVHTDPNTGKVLEVATGNPFVIYVVVPDPSGNLRLTRGGTFSYYEFKHPMTDRLSDEEWHEMLDTAPPDLPEWIKTSIPIHSVNSSFIRTMVVKED
ncbi:MAG: DUF3160 domain-containing protein [Candidatus Hodarchaeota archaeon]